MKRGALIACGLALAAGGAAWLSRRPPTASVPAVATPAGAGPSTIAPPPPAPAAPPAAAVAGGRPRSLRGTRIDGDLELDPLGHFRPSANARRLFDYHLAASGEAPLDAIRARIVAVIARRLPAEAAREATDLLDRYLLYRERARQLADAGLGGDDHHARFAAIWALRREVLGTADAEALFGTEEAYDRLALERARILGDPSLSAEERAAQLAAADAALPEPVREALEAATLPMRLDAAEEAVRAAGGGAAEIQALRTEVAGAEAAQRLATLDEERARWEQRLAAFRDARAAIDQDGTKSAGERAAAVEALLAGSFTPTERLRVQALDRLATAPAP